MRLLTNILIMGCALQLALPCIADSGVTINGTSTVIVSPTNAPTYEKTAARELADYIEKITDKRPLEVNEGTNIPSPASIVYVGQTKFAIKNGIDFQKLDHESWIIRTYGKDLVLAGGNPRGTLYSVYHFLEDQLGVRWWTPYEEYVPSKASFTIDEINRKCTPAFESRDILLSGGGASYPPVGTAKPSVIFAAHSRLNRMDSVPISSEYGGAAFGFGLPWHCHTFYTYVPPEQYFQNHSEYYPLKNGKRDYRTNSNAPDAQLCLTNSELRELLVQKVEESIKQSNAEAEKNGLMPPADYSLSQNDSPRGWCECAICSGLVKQESSLAGPLIDFINYVAGRVGAAYPNVYISTLAYGKTDVPPKSIYPAKNVIIQLTNTDSDLTQPITATANAAWKKKIDGWARIAPRLFAWEYGVTYNDASGLPYPNLEALKDNIRYYKSKGVKGVFIESEWIVRGELRDLKLWVISKLLEDPNQDYSKLIVEYTNGYYGSAGKMVRDYLHALEDGYRSNPCGIHMNTTKDEMRYLNVKFISKANSIFDDAYRAVLGNPVLERRVRNARLPIDRSILILWKSLNREWNVSRNGQPFPFDRSAIFARYSKTVNEQLELRKADDSFVSGLEQNQLASERLTLELSKDNYDIPKRFADIPRDRVFDCPAEVFRSTGGEFELARDSDSEIGHAAYRKCPDIDKMNFNPPMMWGLYDSAKCVETSVKPLQFSDLNPGYHWYCMGTYELTPSTYIWLTWCWYVQVPEVEIADIVKSSPKESKFQIWVSVKYTGSLFFKKASSDSNTISIDRVVFIRE